ncbi:bi-domain-containing oxidoreductase [Candidatus Dependentiae bacterium]
MRQVFLDRGNIVVKEVCQPHLDENSVLVSVHYSFLGSGAEISTIEKAQESIFFSDVPNKIKKVIKSVSKHGMQETAHLVKNKMRGHIQPLGYSCSGEVISVGDQVKNIRAGDLVACASANFAKHADIIAIPQHLVTPVKNKENLKEASVATIGALALQSIRRANLQIGEHVCVIGLGVLGQITMQMANLSGCNTVGIDICAQRLALAKQLGASAALHSFEDDVINEIDYITNHHGMDCTIIAAASKSDSIIAQAMEITRKKGKVVIVSDVGLNLERNPFYKKEIELIVSCSYGPGINNYENEPSAHPKRDYPYEIVRWTENRNMQAFIKLLENKKITINKLITDNIPVSDIAKAYTKLKTRKSLGVIIHYNTKPSSLQTGSPETGTPDLGTPGPNTQNTLDPTTPERGHTKDTEIKFMPATKDVLKVGIVGTGEFSEHNLLPVIAQQKNATIHTITGKDISRSLHMSKIYGAKKCFASYHEFFEHEFLEKESNNICDVVVISSEHKYHCQQALNALQKGKAVFLEKPMATNPDQLHQIQNFLHTHPTTPFCVDYSRSFSPFIQKIKCAIKNRKSPLVINYRMNVELLKKNKPVQEDMGEGRIIGEACSIFDIFYELTNSKPIAVSVESLHSPNSQLFPTDNFCAQVSFQDGSICSLTYTSLGHQNMGRERMELFFDSKSIVMKDYKVLQGFGLRKSFDECSKFPDKGRHILISNFFAKLKNKKFTHPIDLQRLYDVANLTITVDKLACQGGGQKNLT